MNHEGQLRLQAWLDGALAEREGRAVAATVAQDAEARGLAEELRSLHAALAGAELARPVPETREFYWAGIARAIARPEAREAPPVRPLWLTWRLRLAAPAALLIALVLVLTPASRQARRFQQAAHTESDNPRDDVGYVTFRSEGAGMTVLWIASR